MYTINFKRESKQINQFFLMNSSMAGEKALGVFDNEEDLSYYALAHHYYKTYNLSTVCSYTDLYDLEGKRMSDKQLDTVIQKYFPPEKKNKLEEVETKSKQYLENIFGDIKESKKINKSIKI